MPMASGRAARPASGWRGQEGGWHKGKLAGGLHFWWPLTASQGGHSGSAGPVPWETPQLLTCLFLQEEMPGLSNRELPGACCPLSIHLLWLQPPPPQGWFLPNSPHFSGLRCSSFFFPFPQHSFPQLPLNLRADHSASPPAPFLQEVSPDSPLTCLGGESAQGKPLWWLDFVLPTVPY